MIMDEQSVPLWLSLWRYFRTKIRNAWWVLRTKGLRGVWLNVVNEVMWLSGRYTIHQANAGVGAGIEERKAPKVPDSAFVNSRKVLPASPRPTHLRMMPNPTPTSDIDRAAIGRAILRIKDELRKSSAIKGRLTHDG